jgi:dTDP-4-amino-4,6-dideoxygalactose transaminase
MESLGPASDRRYYKKGYPYNRFPVLLRRPESKEKVSSEGDRAGISPMYPSPVHRIPELAGTIDVAGYEGAEAIAAALVTLPTHALLKDGDRRRVVELLENGMGKGK